MEPNEKIISGATKLLVDCMGITPDEKALIVCDEKKIDIAQSFMIAGLRNGLNISLVEAISQEKGDVDAFIANAMLNADAVIAITSMSYSHTSARGNATAKGVRVATMPEMTLEIAENFLDSDYKEVSKRSFAIKNLLSDATNAHITTPFGTDLHLDLSGRTAIADSGVLTEAGSFGNLPAGEGFIAPVEDSVNGTYVLERGDCIAYLGLVKDRTELVFRDGWIVDIKGNETAAKLKDFLSDKDKEATGIAELGIGTKPTERFIGHPLVDEKILGTVHIAFGNNAFFGGKRHSDIHIDCIAHNATVYLDDKCIVKDGQHIYEF